MISAISKRFKNWNSTNLMILFMSFSNIIGNVLTIASGLLIARWLLPADLGLFNSFSVITSYIILAQLGIPSGLTRELPLYYGKGETDTAHQYAAVAQYWGLILGLSAMGLASIVSLYFAVTGQYIYAAGAFTVGITSLQTFYVTKYLDVLYRTNRDFNYLSRIKLITSVTSFAAVIFVWWFGFYGLCIRAGVLALVDFYFTWRWKPFHVKPFWDKQRYRELSRIGLPMYSIANIYGLWPTIQRTWVLALGGAHSLGLFALAIIIENAMKTITSSINSVIYPTMIAQWSKGASVGDLLRLTAKPIAIAIGFFAVAVPLGWWLLPAVVSLFLPNYTEGVYAAQWMLLVGFAELFIVFASIYNVVRKQRDRLFSYLTGILCWALTVYFLYRTTGFSIDIFPKGMLVGFLAMLFINVYKIRTYKTLTIAA